jgi:hypothetical protein
MLRRGRRRGRRLGRSGCLTGDGPSLRRTTHSRLRPRAAAAPSPPLRANFDTLEGVSAAGAERNGLKRCSRQAGAAQPSAHCGERQWPRRRHGSAGSFEAARRSEIEVFAARRPIGGRRRSRLSHWGAPDDYRRNQTAVDRARAALGGGRGAAAAAAPRSCRSNKPSRVRGDARRDHAHRARAAVGGHRHRSVPRPRLPRAGFPCPSPDRRPSSKGAPCPGHRSLAA